MQTKDTAYEMQRHELRSYVIAEFYKDPLTNPNRTTAFYDRMFQQLSYRHL